MTRLARNLESNELYHVFTRGVNKKTIFHNDIQRYSFLKYIREAQKKFGIEIMMYCLMGNHYHLALKNNDNQLEYFMHSINQRYAQLHNTYQDEGGPLFGDRYKSIEINSLTYLSTLFAYIHLNPVKDGFVHHPGNWKWSSYNTYAKNWKNTICNKELFIDQFQGDKTLALDYMHHKYTDQLHGIINKFFDKNKEDKLHRYLEIYQRQKDIHNSNNYIKELKAELGLSYGFISEIAGKSKTRVFNICN